jgi:hypothetical protein
MQATYTTVVRLNVLDPALSLHQAQVSGQRCLIETELGGEPRLIVARSYADGRKQRKLGCFDMFAQLLVIELGEQSRSAPGGRTNALNVWQAFRRAAGVTHQACFWRLQLLAYSLGH